MNVQQELEGLRDAATLVAENAIARSVVLTKRAADERKVAVTQHQRARDLQTAIHALSKDR